MAAMWKYSQFVFLGVLALGVTTVWYAVFQFEDAQRLRVTFFDVGQGDAIFIEAPGGNQVLVDGGPDDRILARLGSALPFWDRSIDMIMLTHPHADHVAGLLDVLKRYRVGMVVESGVDYGTSEYAEWRRVLEEKQVPVVQARRGQSVHLSQDITLNILAPFDSSAPLSSKNIHEAMAVSRLVYASTSVLLMGDAERPVEYRLIASGDAIASTILKAGHHGSKTSSTESFVEAASPKAVVISVGRKNRYGHPHADVLERFQKLGIPVHRTDTEGNIVMESDGRAYRLISR